MIIWIASYPKSGNTWVRSLLASYFFSKNGEFNFDHLKHIAQFSPVISNSTLEEKTNYQAKVSKSWIPTQELINKDKKIHLYKTHNAVCSINGNFFTNKKNTIGAIYITRDPRNILTSLSNHYEINNIEAFNFLTNKRKIIFPSNVNNYSKNKEMDFNFLGDWSGHYLSWKNIQFCSIKIVKYEDMINNTKKTFLSILDYLSKIMKVQYDKDKIDKCIKSTDFEKLSSLEVTDGFNESALSTKTKKKIKFFNLGKKNKWINLVDKKLVAKIEKHFEKEMNELGYL
tara:strand:+ start:136 stop:990 length:855 start_codon:yes stop_codon:yes gene_type:complete